jgi:hypothetical protein
VLLKLITPQAQREREKRGIQTGHYFKKEGSRFYSFTGFPFIKKEG